MTLRHVDVELIEHEVRGRSGGHPSFAYGRLLSMGKGPDPTPSRHSETLCRRPRYRRLRPEVSVVSDRHIEQLCASSYRRQMQAFLLLVISLILVHGMAGVIDAS